MLIGITLVLVTIGVALIINIYSLVNPFINNLGDIRNYNIAYYGAISSVERGKLVLKFHKSGFEGSGGWVGSTIYGPSSDQLNTGFSAISNSSNGMRYEIKSILTGGTVPQVGNGNTDPDLRSSDSIDFNKLEYGRSDEIIFDIDNTKTASKYYTGSIDWIYSNQLLSGTTIISGNIRLPTKVNNFFGNHHMCTNSTCDIDRDGIGDDIIASRSLFGNYSGQNFLILPSLSTVYSPTPGITSTDTALRETVINNGSGNSNILFGSAFNPIKGVSRTDPTTLNLVPPYAAFSGKNFQYILGNSNITGVHLKLSMVNIMKDVSDNIFPFLEYKFQVLTSVGGSPVPIPDRFFHIMGNSKVGKYNVQVKIDVPITNTDSSSDFAILF